VTIGTKRAVTNIVSIKFIYKKLLGSFLKINVIHRFAWIRNFIPQFRITNEGLVANSGSKGKRYISISNTTLNKNIKVISPLLTKSLIHVCIIEGSR
jgi:hypothetical protein